MVSVALAATPGSLAEVAVTTRVSTVPLTTPAGMLRLAVIVRLCPMASTMGVAGSRVTAQPRLEVADSV